MFIWSDVGLALRLLRRAPGASAVAVLSTALSVGAIAAVFTAVQAVLIKPLPYSRPDELVLFRADYHTGAGARHRVFVADNHPDGCIVLVEIGAHRWNEMLSRG
jgi:hypothetical protein